MYVCMSDYLKKQCMYELMNTFLRGGGQINSVVWSMDQNNVHYQSKHSSSDLEFGIIFILKRWKQKGSF